MHTVSVLLQEEGYRLSPKEAPRAKPEEFFEGSDYISLYKLTRVISQTLSISKNVTSRIVLPGWTILEDFIFCIVLAAGPIFSSIR